MSNPDSLVGQQIGQYAIIRRLGRGGMGVVYQARHATLEREVAIKFLAQQFSADPVYIERFLREARVVARLSHPNIIVVHDAGVEAGLYYFVMEYVEGRDMGQWLKECRHFSETDTIQYGLKATSALACAHKVGIIHRDIKPENLIITKEGDLKVGDLGLAKQISSDTGSLTMAGVIVGTPFYISPEQVRGSKNVDARADIYSLGATLYHLVTGQIPYRGSSAAEIMAKHLTEPFCWPQTILPELSDGFCRTLCKMMAKDPDQRFQTMEEVAEVLEELRQGRVPASLAGVQAIGSTIMTAPSAAVEALPTAAPVPPVIPPSLPRNRGFLRSKKGKTLRIGCIVGVLLLVGLILLGIIGGLIEDAKKKKAAEAAGAVIYETNFESNEVGSLPSPWKVFVQEYTAADQVKGDPASPTGITYQAPDGSKVSWGVFEIDEASQKSKVLCFVTQPAPGTTNFLFRPFLQACATVETNQAYQLFFQIRSANASTDACVEIAVPGRTFENRQLMLKNEWQEVLHDFEPLENGEMHFSIIPSREADIWLDSVVIRKTTATSPISFKADFESDKVGALTEPWKVYIQKNPRDQKRKADEPELQTEAPYAAPDGSQASWGILEISEGSGKSKVLQLLIKPATQTNEFQYVCWISGSAAVKANQEYELSFRARAAGDPVPAGFHIEAPGISEKSQEIKEMQLEDKWQPFKRTFKSTEDGEVVFTITPWGEGEIWLDDFVMRQVHP